MAIRLLTPPPPSGGVSSEAYVYLLKSLKDGKFYLGWTTDLKRRLDAHNAGLNKSTVRRRPFELVYYEACADAQAAKERERKLKKNPNMLRCFQKRAHNCASLLISKKEVVR